MHNIQIDLFNDDKQWHMSFGYEDSECRAWGTCSPFTITYLEDGCGLDILATCTEELAQEILSEIQHALQVCGDREPFFPPAL